MSKKGRNSNRTEMKMIKMFVSQWMESLGQLEKEILQLEIHEDDIELIDTILDRVHSIKGGASFAGIQGITTLCYEVELILEAVKGKEIAVTSELIDGLLLASENIKGIIGQLKKSKALSLEQNLNLSKLNNVNQTAEFLETLRKKCECVNETIKHNDHQRTESDESELLKEEPGVLQSEEFKEGLLNGLKEQFQYESTEHIENIENVLLIQLDRDGSNLECLQEMFRAIHSLKGGTGIYLAALPSQSPEYLGLKKFSEILHTFENLLALIRDKKYRVDKHFINLSYKVIDYAKGVLCAVALDDWSKKPSHELSEMIEEYTNRVFLCEEQGQMEEVTLLQSDSVSASAGKAKTFDDSEKRQEEKQSLVFQSQSIRVSQEKLDQMMNMISELVIAKNSFMHISSKLDSEYDLPEISKEVKQLGAYVNRISDELQNAIMSIRMVEIKTIFQKMPRVVRDIGQQTGKKMELIMEGERTEIDKTIIEQISDPLVHLIRNAADHGIESIKERIAKNKPEIGKIILRAYNKNKHVYIEIEDDGKGMDGEQIKEKAVNKGFIAREEAEKMDPKQWLNFIFFPGFSTAEKITEVSGRGVGMDIVKSNINKINGTIAIESKVDVGTKITIRLPLTLAVSRGLIVEVLGESYIFPLEYISGTVKIRTAGIHEHEGKCFTHLRGEVIGVEWLSRVFLMGERSKDKEELNAVIITNGQEKCAIVVDKFKGEQEFVVKALNGHLANIPGISGSTLLGNGKVILIVNPLDIFKLIKLPTKMEVNHG